MTKTILSPLRYFSMLVTFLHTDLATAAVATTHWEAITITADETKAGNGNAHVYMTLTDSTGFSQEVKINQDGTNNFVRGRTDLLYFETSAMGDLDNIVMRIEDKNMKLVDNITLNNLNTSQEYVFIIAQWISDGWIHSGNNYTLYPGACHICFIII